MSDWIEAAKWLGGSIAGLTVLWIAARMLADFRDEMDLRAERRSAERLARLNAKNPLGGWGPVSHDR